VLCSKPRRRERGRKKSPRWQSPSGPFNINLWTRSRHYLSPQHQEHMRLKALNANYRPQREGSYFSTLVAYRFREAKCAVDYLRQVLATYEILYRIGTRFNVLYYSTNYFRCALNEKK